MEPEPVWNARQVVPNARTIPESSYIVSPGDTLRGVGNSTGAGSEILAKANGLQPPYVIYPGQRLRVPGGRYHLVSDGETGIAIARAYRSEEHTSELQSLMRISYAVFCLKKKTNQ